MITTAYCCMMAQYNVWMNSRLYAICEKVPPSDLYADRGAFFKSIYGTLNHIMYADLAFLSRFTGNPAVVPKSTRIFLAALSACTVNVRASTQGCWNGLKRCHQHGLPKRSHIKAKLMAWFVPFQNGCLLPTPSITKHITVVKLPPCSRNWALMWAPLTSPSCPTFRRMLWRERNLFWLTPPVLLAPA